MGGKLTPAQVKTVLTQTGLPAEVLRPIWELSDVDKDGKLDDQEFALACYLCWIGRGAAAAGEAAARTRATAQGREPVLMRERTCAKARKHPGRRRKNRREREREKISRGTRDGGLMATSRTCN